MLLWTAVTRDETVIAEAGDDHQGGTVIALAKNILGKKPSPGRHPSASPWQQHALSNNGFVGWLGLRCCAC